MPEERPIRVAMVLVDAFEVAEERLAGLDPQRPKMHPVIHTLLDGLARREDVEVHALYADRSVSSVETRREGSVIYTAVPVSRRRLPVPMAGYWARFWALRAYLRELKPHLVHAQGTERESGMVAAHSGFSGVITMHGNFREIVKVFKDPPLSYHWITAHLETHVLKRIGHIICISKYVEEITKPFAAEKTVIPNAVRGEFLEIARPPRASVPRVVCMGTIDARKHTRDILSACELLWQEGLEFTFHVHGSVGFGPGYGQQFLNDLEPWVKKGKAFLEGVTWKPWEELAKADVLVSASVEESFGMNVLEAMACGTPPVGPDLGGIRDIIVDGKTGFLYPAGNRVACAEAIKKLLTDRALWASLSKEGRNRAVTNFSGDRVAEATVACYRKILTHARP